MTTTTLLIVLDGWGHRDNPHDNAIEAARTPHWDQLTKECPHTLISGSGMDVGLPAGQMGNSEVGHMNLGAGRIVYQDLTRIAKSIADGEFQRNPVILEALQRAKARDRAVHIFGLLSPGGVHSHEDQIAELVRLCGQEQIKHVFVHAFLDGRDTPPRSALSSLKRMDALLAQTAVGRIATICGRYYAMDRDNRWERTQRAYDMLTLAVADFSADTPMAALEAAYARNESDEFVQPTIIRDARGNASPIADDDVVIYMNFRADRARQLTRAFVLDAFDRFERRARPRLQRFVTLTEYAADIPAAVAYTPDSLRNTLGEYLARLGKTQLRIAETEKYAHVTFFFNGGREDPFAHEERVLVPSPKVATYDLKPEMSAPEVTDRLVEAIRSRKFDFIVCNYANGDMVGHTGDMRAAVLAVEALDSALGRVTAAIREVGGQCLITADHGNVEQMTDPSTGQPHTAHTCEPVPLLYVGDRPLTLTPGGLLSDVAPTLLTLMQLPIPKEMTGHNLARLDDRQIAAGHP